MKGFVTLLCLLLAGCATPKQSQEIALPAEHVVQPGETLAFIARRYYGEERRSEGLKAIVAANPHITPRPKMSKQLVITIPKLADR
jgi:hypothetical protein